MILKYFTGAPSSVTGHDQLRYVDRVRNVALSTMRTHLPDEVSNPAEGVFRIETVVDGCVGLFWMELVVDGCVGLFGIEVVVEGCALCVVLKLVSKSRIVVASRVVIGGVVSITSVVIC